MNHEEKRKLLVLLLALACGSRQKTKESVVVCTLVWMHVSAATMRGGEREHETVCEAACEGERVVCVREEKGRLPLLQGEERESVLWIYKPCHLSSHL